MTGWIIFQTVSNWKECAWNYKIHKYLWTKEIGWIHAIKIIYNHTLFCLFEMNSNNESCKNNYCFKIMYLKSYLPECVYVTTCDPEARMGRSDSLEPQPWTTVWVLGSELRSFERSTNALNCWAITPAPYKQLLKRCSLTMCPTHALNLPPFCLSIHSARIESMYCHNQLQMRSNQSKHSLCSIHTCSETCI